MRSGPPAISGSARPTKDPALQDDETAELIANRGWKLTDTYTDHGVSGSRERRPELDRLLRDVRRRRIDVVLVWKADRLFRSLKAMVTTLDEWAALGVGFVSATEVFDSTTPQGKLLLHVGVRGVREEPHHREDEGRDRGGTMKWAPSSIFGGWVSADFAEEAGSATVSSDAVAWWAARAEAVRSGRPYRTIRLASLPTGARRLSRAPTRSSKRPWVSARAAAGAPRPSPRRRAR